MMRSVIGLLAVLVVMVARVPALSTSAGGSSLFKDSGVVVLKKFSSSNCSGSPTSVEEFVAGKCYNQSNQPSELDCMKADESSSTTCAFYHHFYDLSCEHPANNHTLLCDSCDCEGGTDFDILKCNASGRYTAWHGACGPTCDLEECKFSGIDHVGVCIPTPPHQPYPAVMLLGFGPCPTFVRNRTFAPTTSACAGDNPLSVQLLQVNVCDNNALWSC